MQTFRPYTSLIIFSKITFVWSCDRIYQCILVLVLLTTLVDNNNKSIKTVHYSNILKGPATSPVPTSWRSTLDSRHQPRDSSQHERETGRSDALRCEVRCGIWKEWCQCLLRGLQAAFLEPMLQEPPWRILPPFLDRARKPVASRTA